MSLSRFKQVEFKAFSHKLFKGVQYTIYFDIFDIDKHNLITSFLALTNKVGRIAFTGLLW